MKQKVVQKAPEQAKKPTPNLTGIPTQMKLDFERRSGLSFDDVRVHYNSDKPTRIGALAYTQGNQVYIGPGQERHLRHELGHVVQQKATSVPTTEVRYGFAINRDPKLELQADKGPELFAEPSALIDSQTATHVVQGKFEDDLNNCGDDELADLVSNELKNKFKLTAKQKALLDLQKETIKSQINTMKNATDTYSHANLIAAIVHLEAIAHLLKLDQEKNSQPYIYRTKDDNKDADEDEKSAPKKLKESLEELYGLSQKAPEASTNQTSANKSITKKKIFQKLALMYTQERLKQLVQRESFIKAFQNTIRDLVALNKENSEFIKNTKIHSAAQHQGIADSLFNRVNEHPPASFSIDKFVLRHYSNLRDFSEIQSALYLETQESSAQKRSHTENTDWAKLGNVGNTFFFLSVDGNIVCQPGFINNCEFYTEVPLSKIQRTIWFSCDWLDMNSIKGNAYEGNANEIHKILLAVVLDKIYKDTPEEKNEEDRENDAWEKFINLTTEQFANVLCSVYGSFEVKVYGPVKIEGEWKNNPGCISPTKR